MLIPLLGLYKWQPPQLNVVLYMRPFGLKMENGSKFKFRFQYIRPKHTLSMFSPMCFLTPLYEVVWRK